MAEIPYIWTVHTGLKYQLGRRVVNSSKISIYQLMIFRSLSLLALLLTVLACQQEAQEKDPLTQQEEAYFQTPSTEAGEALIVTYESMLDTLSSPEAKLPVAEKAALMYFRTGIPEGLQANFSKIVKDYKTPNSTAAAQRIMDTLLYSITDPETQRLIPNVARQYIQLTDIYAQARPEAPESPEQLYKAGEIARSIGAYQQALNIYANVESYFPQYEKAPKALFMQAFTYAEDLQNEEQARIIYERFIEKYPEDDFVDDAQILLENLGTTII
jgi:TolA-binding protein